MSESDQSSLNANAPADRIEYLPPVMGGGLGAWVAIPGRLASTVPPLVAIHGIGRDACSQARMFMPRAAAQGRLVIAPLFDEACWRRYQQLHGGPRRADVALLELIGWIGELWSVDVRRLALFGYSGGAQFAHRFAMLHPHRIANLCVCASGWYTWPDQTPFPGGVGPGLGRNAMLGEVAGRRLAEFLRIPIEVAVGIEDQERDASLRRGAIDAQQGWNRRVRAARWVQAVRAAARRHGLDASIRITELPGAGHDFRQCMRGGNLARLAMPGARITGRAATANVS